MTSQENKEVKKETSKAIGRCFETVDMEVGTGETAQAQKGVETHYYIELLEDGAIALEVVGEDGEPTGQIIENISTEEFGTRFKTCSRHKCSLMQRTLEEISQKMAENRAEMGEKHFENGEFEKAEDKFKRALKFDEKNLSANLGLGKTYMEQQRFDEASEVFKALSEIENILEPENKYFFNETGIYLRRLGFHDKAICNYEIAIKIDENDAALYFNLSRAYKEKGAIQEKDKLGFIQKAIQKMQEAIDVSKKQEPESDEDKERNRTITTEGQKYLDSYMEEEQEALNSLLKRKVVNLDI